MELTNFINQTSLVLILLLQSLEQGVIQRVKKGINLVGEIGGAFEASIDLSSLLLDDLVVGDQVHDLSLGLVLRISDSSRVIIEKINDIVNFFDNDLLSHLERPVGFSRRVAREGGVIKSILVGVLRIIKVAILPVSVDIFVGLIKLLLELTVELVFPFQILDVEKVSQGVDVVRDLANLGVELVDPSLQVIIVLLEGSDQSLRLLGVLVHQVSLGFQAVGFQHVNGLSQSGQILLILSGEGADSLLQ